MSIQDATLTCGKTTKKLHSPWQSRIRSLSGGEVSLLRKELNLAVTPNIPSTEIIANVESVVRPPNAEQSDTINNILQHADPPKPNITKEQRGALRSLKENNSVMIPPADKGGSSIVFDTDTYHATMSALIETGPYKLLKKYPTDLLTRKLSEKLLSLKRNGHISEAVCNKIRPRHEQPPRIHGLLKSHKSNVPLRPIVSCV